MMWAELSIQIVAFLLFFFLLKRMAWKPLLTMLDDRRARIEEGFRHIAQGKADIERLKQELAKRLATIEDEARTKIQQAVLEGKRIAVEMQEESRAHAKAIITKSKETIDLELAKAKVTLRDQLVDMTVEAVERLLKQKLNAKTDEQLVTSILEELGQAERTRP